MRARFFRKGAPSNAYNSSSSIWLGIKSLVFEMERDAKWLVNNGEPVDFMIDSWLSGGKICERQDVPV